MLSTVAMFANRCLRGDVPDNILLWFAAGAGTALAKNKANTKVDMRGNYNIHIG